MVRRALLVMGSLLGGCGQSATPTTESPVSVAGLPAPLPPSAVTADGGASAEGAANAKREARQAKLVAKMLNEVSRVRGLSATRTVPGVVLPRERLIDRVKEHVAIEIPPDAIKREGQVLQILGFLPTTFDYAAQMFALLQAELAGFYEPADGTMYMAGDLDDGNAEATLAPELVHALQDQHWDLKKRSKYKPGQSDRSSALACLAEGDATSAMADILVSHMAAEKTALDLPEDVFVKQVMGGMNAGPSASAPHVMRMSLVAPYVDGTLFVHALRRRGGWKEIDRAWELLPTTTEQVLHIDKFDAHEPALEVSAPTAASLGSGWVVADEDTYGEQGLRLTFGEWMPDGEAKLAAGGWGGDRAALFSEGARLALAIHVRFDPSNDPAKDGFAARGYRSLSAAIAHTFGKPTLSEGSLVCIERPDLGPLAFSRKGRDVVLLAGPASTGATWASQGTCAEAKKWATEVLGNR